MQIVDEAIILSSRKFGENSGIACVLTKSNGLYRGLVRHITSKKKCGIYQTGNFTEIIWKARMAEHLGNLSAELIHPTCVEIMHSPLKLAALESICSTISIVLQERESATTTYHNLYSFLKKLITNEEEWQKDYISLEIQLLSEIGYGLDFSECAATGTTENLVYVSPKSGRAVCRESGLEYHDKMLKLPQFLLYKPHANNDNQITEGITLTNYFLDKCFFAANNITQPNARVRFVKMLYSISG